MLVLNDPDDTINEPFSLNHLQTLMSRLFKTFSNWQVESGITE
jgi:hypothetical protein